jgi:hypothetical protein
MEVKRLATSLVADTSLGSNRLPVRREFKTSEEIRQMLANRFWGLGGQILVEFAGHQLA